MLDKYERYAYNIDMKAIDELRQITGLSQSKFAEKYHLNKYTLQNWEHGRFPVPDAILYLLNRIITEVDYAEGHKDKDIS